MSGHDPSIAAIPHDPIQSRLEGPTLEAQSLNQSAGKGKTALVDFSLVVHPGEILAIIDLGEGNSNPILDILRGSRQPEKGNVLFGGEDLYKKPSAFRSIFGFVPRKEIVHSGLSVFEVLDYSAKIRLPREADRATRLIQIEKVLSDLELEPFRKRRVDSLEEEPRKRVSLGVELLTNPDVIILDDPTCGFSLSAEARLMRILRKQADQGKIVILSARSLKNYLQVDRLAIILPGGYQGWFGPPEEAQDFFNSIQSHSVGNGKTLRFPELFEILESTNESEAQAWAERCKIHPAYKKYQAAGEQQKSIDSRMGERPLALQRAKAATASAPSRVKKISSLRQFIAVSARNLRRIARDRLSLFLLIVAPVLATGLDWIFSSRNMYDRISGSSEQIVSSLVVLIFLVMFFSAIAWVRDINREALAIHRERESALRLTPYLLSKIWIVVFFAFFHALIWTAVHFLIVDILGGINVLLSFYITLVLVALIGGLIGLTASSISNTAASAGLLAIILVFTQFFLTNGLRTVSLFNSSGSALSWLIPSQVAFDSLVTAGGHGNDLALDGCLNLPPAERDVLNEDQKRACTCLGENVLTRCNFPGIQQFSTPYLAQTGTDTPVLSREGLRLPVQPVPIQGMAIEEYRAEVDRYTEEIEKRWLNLNEYVDEVTAREVTRNLAIKGAEKMVLDQFERYGRSFYVYLPGHWAVLLIMAGIFVLIFAASERIKELKR